MKRNADENLDKVTSSLKKVSGSKGSMHHETMKQKLAEDCFTQIFGITSLVFWLTKLKPEQVLYVSPAFERIWGRPASELYADPRLWTKMIHPEDRERVKRVFDKWLQKPDRCEYQEEYRVVRPDGSMSWISDYGNAICDKAGRVYRVAGVAEEITERKQVEEALWDSQRQLSIRNNITEIFLTTPDDEMYGEVMNVLLEAMESKYGIFGYIDEDKRLIIPSMTRDIWEKCQVPDKTIVYPREKWGGIWGRALKEKKSLYANEGLHVPEGHVPITKVLVVPIMYGGKVIGLLEVANKSTDYNHKDQEFLESIAGKIAPILNARLQRDREERERKQAEEALKRSEERYTLAQQAANIGSWDWDISTGELVWSEQIEPMFGFGRGEFGATYEAFLESVHSDDRRHVLDSLNACVEDGKDYAIEHRIIWPDGTARWVSETGGVIRDENGKALRMLGIVQDVTERKERESRQRLAELVLERLNQKGQLLDVIRDILKLVKESIGFNAVGIRLSSGKDFPYFVVEGFPADFVEAENYLCAHDEDGEVILDSEGKTLLECMCGNVLSGRTDSALPFFTQGGSFWTNSTTKLLASTPPEDLQVPTRNLCNQAGYESVALISLRSGDQTVGLLQLNDTLPNRFTPETISFFENIGASIGIAIARIEADHQVEDLAKFPSENPFPVLRISQDGTILYSNGPGSRLLDKWQRYVGDSAPSQWCKLIREVVSSGRPEVEETNLDDRIISFVLAPVKDTGYVNVYGRDITKRKEAEQKLQNARDELEMRVKERTAELTQVVEALQMSESRLAEAQRIAHLGNWDWDIVRNKLWWSDEVYRIFGTNPQEFQTTYEAFLSYVHPDDRDFVRQSVNEALYQQKPYSIDHRITRPDETECIVHERAEVTYDANKRVIRMIGTVQDVTEQKKAEEEIRRNQQQLRSLAAQLHLTEERERRKIASDLHDSVGQILAFARREIVTLQKAAPEKLAASIKEIGNQLNQAVKQTRTLSFDLSPSVLYDLGFEVAIEDLTERFAKERKIQCHFENSKEPKPLSDAIKILLYRSIRELLINIAKHAEAKLAKVSLARDNNDIYVTVEDNGKGFDLSILDSSLGKSKGFGIFSIRERLAHIGGHFEIHSDKDKGTKVVLIAPIDIEKKDE